ncbi:hypothetical protein [Geodermatophilus amargosae]|nr:hypothetical protein [Geodermatophilus amargosae]
MAETDSLGCRLCGDGLGADTMGTGVHLWSGRLIENINAGR